jgi:hypothetical protein
MAPPILSLALPSETGRVLSIQSHTVQVSLHIYCSICKIFRFRFSFYRFSFVIEFKFSNSI